MPTACGKGWALDTSVLQPVRFRLCEFSRSAIGPDVSVCSDDVPIVARSPAASSDASVNGAAAIASLGVRPRYRATRSSAEGAMPLSNHETRFQRFVGRDRRFSGAVPKAEIENALLEFN
jgi:hypothetical protein